MKCKKCGTEFNEGIFCPECGEKYNELVKENIKNQEFIENKQNDNEVINSDSGKKVEKDKEIINNSQNNKDETKETGRTMAILSLVFGIISLLSCGILIIPEILGIIFGMKGKENKNMSGMASAGLICSIIALVMFLGVFVLSLF